MRMGAFMFGGIVGAALAVAVMRNNKEMRFSMAKAGEAMDKMIDDAKNKLMDLKFTPRTILTYSTKNKDGLDRVEEIIHEDPALSHEAKEILAEKGERSSIRQ